MVRTSLNDSQVMYWAPGKYVAKLRTRKTDARPVLFTIDLDAGHGDASGRYDHLREIAFDYALILTQLSLLGLHRHARRSAERIAPIPEAHEDPIGPRIVRDDTGPRDEDREGGRLAGSDLDGRRRPGG